MAAAPLRQLFNIRVPKIKVRYSPNKVPTFREAETIASEFNPRRPAVLDVFNNRPSNILSWIVVTDVSKKTLPLSTQRNRLRRRWHAAVIQALKLRGMDSKGQKLVERQTKETAVPFLKGTMEIIIYEGYGFEETPEQLVKHSEDIIESLLGTSNSTINAVIDGGRTNGRSRAERFQPVARLQSFSR